MNGCDVSHYQGVIDWPTLAQHVGFAIIKATEGVSVIDSQFSANRQGARDVNLLRGFYHFARFDSDGYSNTPEAEAQYFYDIVGTNLLPGEIVVLDYEVVSSSPTTQVQAFLDTFYNLSGVRAFVYGNISGLNDLGGFGPYPVWVAAPSYPVEQTGIPVKFGFVMQQYGTGNIAGITGAVDLDHFFGDGNAFQSYGLPQPAPTPPVVSPSSSLSSSVSPSSSPSPSEEDNGVSIPVTVKPPVVVQPIQQPVNVIERDFKMVLGQYNKLLVAAAGLFVSFLLQHYGSSVVTKDVIYLLTAGGVYQAPNIPKS